MPSSPLESLASLPLHPTAAARLGLAGERLRLRRAWPRSPEHLLLEYEAPDGAAVPGQWHRERSEGERALTGLPPCDTALVTLDDAGYVAVQVRGADRRLPALAPLLTRPEARLLAHQPGRRAVVRLPSAGGASFAKLTRPGRALALAELGMAAARCGGNGFDAPGLIACDDASGLVIWTGLAGTALHDLGGGPALERGARAAGAALRALHDAPWPSIAPAHGPAEEAAVLARWVDYAMLFNPVIAGRVAALLPEVVALLDQARGPYRPIHRDFYDKQVLIAPDGRAGIIDFDTLAYGEPALDLANALVHFELRALQGRIGAEDAGRARAALLAGYAPGFGVLARLEAYAAATCLRLACVYALRPRWLHCARALAELLPTVAVRAWSG
jgi:hypothetical protein